MSFLLLHSPAPHALEDDNNNVDGTALGEVSPPSLQDDEEVGQGTHQTEAAIDGVFALLKSPAQGNIEQQEYNDNGNDEAVAQDDSSLLQVRSNVDFSSFALKPPRVSSSVLAMPPRTASPMMAMMSSLMEGSTPTLIRRDNTGSRRGNNNNTYGSSLHVGRQTVTTQYSYNDSLANYTVNNDDNDNEGDSVNYSYEGPHKSWHNPPTSPSLPTMTTTTTTKRTAYALSSNGDAVLSTSPVVSVNEFQNNSSSTLTSAARGAGRGNDAGDVVNLSISVSSSSSIGIGNARRGPSPQALPHAGSQVSAMSWRTLEGRAGQDASSLNTPPTITTNTTATPITRMMNGDGSTVSLHVSGYQFGPSTSQGSVRGGGRGDDEDDGSSLSAINAMAEGQAPYNYGTPTLTASQRARLRRRRRRQRLGHKSRSSLSSPSFSSSVSSGSGNSGSGGIFALPTAAHTTQHASPASGYTQTSISPGRATPSRSHAHPSHYHHHHHYYSSASLRSPASNAMDGEGEDTGEDDMQDLAVAIMMRNATQPQSINSVDRTEEGGADDNEYVWDGNEEEEEGVVVVGRDGGSVSDGQLDELSETEEARWHIAQPTAIVNTTLSPSSNETLDMLMASLVHEAAYVRSPVVELGDMRINQQHHHNNHLHVDSGRHDEGNTSNSHNVVTHELQYSSTSISDSSSSTATAEWRNAITHGATQPSSMNTTSRRDGGSGSGTWESAAERLERHVSDVVGRVARSYLQPWATRKPWSTTVNSNGNGVLHVSDTHPAHDTNNNNNNTSVPRRERRSQPTAGADKYNSNNMTTTNSNKGSKAGRATQPEVISSSLSTSFGSSGPRVQDNTHTNGITTPQRRNDYTNKHNINTLNGTAVPGGSSTRGEGSQQGGMGSHGNSVNVTGASATINSTSKSKAKGSGLSAAQRAAIPKPPSLTPPQRRLSDTKRMMAQYDPPSVTFSHEPHVVTQNNNKYNDDISKARTAQLNGKAAAAVAVVPRRDKASEAHMTSIESARGQKRAPPCDTQPSSGTRAATPFTLTAPHASSAIGMTANKQEVSEDGSDAVAGKAEVMTRPDAHVDHSTLSDSNRDNNDDAASTSAANINNDDISRSNNKSRAGHVVPPQPPTTHSSTTTTTNNSSSSRKTYSLPHPPPPPSPPQPAGMKSTDGSKQVSSTRAGSPGRQGENETEEEQHSTTRNNEGENSGNSGSARQTYDTAASHEGGMAPQKNSNSNNDDENEVVATTNAASSATIPPSQPRRRGRSRDDYLPQPRAAAHNDTSAATHREETEKKEEEAEGTRQSDTATGNSNTDSAHNVNSNGIVVVAVTLPPAPMPGILLHRRVFDPTQRHSRLLPARRHLPHGQRRANWTPVYLTSQTESDLISSSSDSDNDEEEEEENNRRIRRVIEEIRGRSADNNSNSSVKDDAGDAKKKTGKPARRLAPLDMDYNNNNRNSTGAGKYTQKGAGGNAEMEHSLTACILPAVPFKEEEERTARTELPSSTSSSSTTTAPSQQSHKHSGSALRGNRFAARHIVVDELDKEAEVEGRRRQKRKAEAEAAAAALSTPLQDGTRTSDEQRDVPGKEKIIMTSTATRSMLSQSTLSSTSESTYNKASGPTAMTLAIPMWATRNSLQSISPTPAYLNMATSDVSSGSNTTSVTQRPSGPRPLSYLPPTTTTAQQQQQKERLASSTTTNTATRSPPSFSQYAHRRYSAPTPGSRQEDTSATLSANLTRRASQSLLGESAVTFVL